MKDFVVEVKIRDRRSNELLDEGKVLGRKGWSWLVNKYGSSLFMMDWDDLFSMSDMSFEELKKYVKSKENEKK